MKTRREYPSRPLVGAGALVHDGRKKILLVKRKFPPNARKWALPGGLVELGERVEDTVTREIREETGLDIALERLLDVATDIHLDTKGKTRYHYVLIDYLARMVKGEVNLNVESSNYGWFTYEQSAKLKMSKNTRSVIARYFEGLKSSHKGT